MDLIEVLDTRIFIVLDTIRIVEEEGVWILLVRLVYTILAEPVAVEHSIDINIAGFLWV